MSASRQVDELHALLDAAVDGIILIDHRGHIQAFNRAAERLFGYAAEELLDRNVSVLMTPEDCDRHDAHLTRYLASREPHVIGRGREVTARRRDGRMFPAFLSVGEVSGADPPRFVGFVHDVSRQRRSEEEARRFQERLWHVSRLATVGETASGFAHELNQPLAAIANYAQACDRLLAQPDADIAEVRGALREITGQAVRAGDIIRRLRGLARPHEGPREPTDVNGLIRDLTDLVMADANAQRVDYRLLLGDGLPPLALDRIQIQQVVLNLVHNAIEALAASAGTTRIITVRTGRTAHGDVEIAVCDTGPGVSSAVVPHLFEPFCTSKTAGTGLGLAISRTMIARHGGTLEYQANVPTGACFILRLPPKTGDEA
jgi:two-component system sensor kinase FixL